MSKTAIPLRACAALLGLAAAAAGFTAGAQEFPTKPIRVYVGNTPGQPPDILARALAPGMQKSLGQPVIVESKPGGGGLVAFEYVAGQPGDGHALVVGGTGLAIFPVFMKDLRFDPLRDILPVSMLVEGTQHLASPANAPWRNFGEMVAYAKANPGKLNFTSTGPQSLLALQGEILNQKFGIRLVEVPYKGGSFEGAVISNEVQLGFLARFQVLPAGNKLKILAVTGARRSPDYPDVPTFTEVGAPEISGFWTMLGAPRGTPKAVIDRLYAVVAATLQRSDTREQIEKLGLLVLGDNPEATARRIASDSAMFAATARRAGIAAQ